LTTDRPRGNPGASRSPRDSGSRPPSGLSPMPSASGQDDSGSLGTLGVLLQRAQAAQRAQQDQAKDTEAAPVEAEVVETDRRQCADCWHAIAFKRDGVSLARCDKNLWVKPTITAVDLNAHAVRRWYIDCPEYDDSE